jgi:aspartate/methionine/tyrosine aminotransferase
VSTPVQLALPALLARGADIRRQILERARRNLAALRAAAANAPAVTVLSCEGGWSAVLQVPALRSEESLVLTLLTDDHVLVHPGFFFDMAREAFLVVSLLTEPAVFDRAIPRVLARASQSGAGL